MDSISQKIFLLINFGVPFANLETLLIYKENLYTIITSWITILLPINNKNFIVNSCQGSIESNVCLIDESPIIFSNKNKYPLISPSRNSYYSLSFNLKLFTFGSVFNDKLLKKEPTRIFASILIPIAL